MDFRGHTLDDNKIDKYVEKMNLSIEEACIMILEEDGKIEERPEVKAATNIKETTRRYEQSEKPRKKAVKERKVDETKKHLIGCVKTLLEGMHAEVTEVKTETEIKFNYGGDCYTFKLTKHRPPKQKEPA